MLALDPARGLTQYVHESWSAQDGLPQNAAGAVVQDAEGYLWLAVRRGLARFDGQNFSPVDFDGGPAPAISALHAGRSAVWAGTAGPGIVYQIRDGRITRRWNVGSVSILALCESGDGNVWIGTSGGLYVLRGDALAEETVRLGLPSPEVRVILEGRGGTLWIGTAKGLHRVDGPRRRTYSTADGLASDDVWALLEDGQGGLWIGGVASDVARLAGDALTTFDVGRGPARATVQALATDGDGNVWVGTRRGLVRLHGGRVAAAPAPGGLARDRVRGLWIDREGGLWVTTDGPQPLHRLRDSAVVAYREVDGVPSDRVRAIRFDPDGFFWLGTEDGLFRWDAEARRTEAYPTSDCLFEPRVTAVTRDSSRRIWFAGAGRLFRLTPGRARPEVVDLGPAAGCYVMATIVEDHRGAMWIASRGAGVFEVEGAKVTRHTTSDGLLDDRVYSLHVSKDGAVWAGTTRGLVRRTGGRWESVLPQNDGRAFAFHEDTDGTLWVGYSSKGLWRLRHGRWSRFGSNEGLPSDSVYGLVEDDDARLWILSEKGLYAVARSDLDGVGERGGRIRPSRVYGEEDGLALPADGLRHPATARTPDGRLWFATAQGVAMVDPRRVASLTEVPVVRIERVVRNGQTVDIRSGGDFPPGRANYEFVYTSLLTPGPIRFRYKLEGFDHDWSEAGTRRVAYYTQLPPGDYTFRVTARTEGGSRESSSAVTFRQRPFLYQSPWFYAACATGVVALVAGAAIARQRRHDREQSRLQRLVDEQTRDLREANRKLDEANRDLAETNENLERRVADGIAALSHAERMAAYGQMVAAVANEVRHPIFALQAAAYVIRDMLADRVELRSPLRTLQTQTERLDVLMKALVDFAKPDALHMAPANVADVVDEALETFFNERRGAPPVKVHLADSLPAVWVDRFRVGQAIVNLLQNAAQHARGLTAITVSARLVQGPDQPVVRVSVADDGAGIPAAELPRIFDPFVTGGTGAGLGLAIVQRIARAHAGDVRVESEPGVGTAFHFDLPLNRTYS